MISKEISLKIDSIYKNNFLGNSLDLTDEEKSTIYEEVGTLLKNVTIYHGESINPFYYKIIVVALVELAKEWRSDEDAWWEYISRRLLGSNYEIKGKVYKEICKSLEGCYIALTPEKKLFLNRQKEYEDYSVFEVACCDDCGKFALVGKIVDDHLT